MDRFILELCDDDTAELIDESTDESVWCSYDDDEFDDDPGDEEAVTQHLVRHGIIDSENDIVEVIDETGRDAGDDDDDEGETESDDD